MTTSLYKRDKSGKIRIWTIETDDRSYWTITGVYPDGKMQKTAPTFVTQKNVGKANETSLEEQVISEAVSKIQKQIDLGYSYEIPTEDKKFEVSLANKYQDRVEKGKLEFPYIIEPKLDGVRCYIQLIDGQIVMKSRKHKEFVSCPHIKENEFVKKFFEAYPDAILDGELYNHDLKDDFNKIVSLVKKTKPKPADLEESAKLVQYHCFDSYYPSEPHFTYRLRKRRLAHLLHQVFGIGSNNVTVENPTVGAVHFVRLTFAIDELGLSGFLPFKWAYCEEDVEQAILEAIAKGYEGIMLKKDVPYFFGRSFDMLKYKKFFDKEYKILRFEEGKGNLTGIAAAVWCVGDNGIEFKAGVNGTQEYARELFENQEKYIGKMATINYQSLTVAGDGKGGVPRFGKMTEIRDYE